MSIIILLKYPLINKVIEPKNQANNIKQKNSHFLDGQKNDINQSWSSRILRRG